MKRVSVFAPASIANIGPGFDMFGVALHALGDVVEARLTGSFTGVRLAGITRNPNKKSLKDLPEGEDNVVVPVAKKVYEAIGNKDVGIELTLHKNLGIGTGLGSSGSSSVAAAVAVNNVLGSPFPLNHPKMLDAVLEGERVACGSRHADNVFPSLLGGFLFIKDVGALKYVRTEVDKDVQFVVATPEVVVATRDARAALLKLPYNLGSLVKFTSTAVGSYIERGHSASRPFSFRLPPEIESPDVRLYVEGAYEVARGLLSADVELLGRGVLKDNIVTPVRQKLIPGYDEVKSAALSARAKGFSIAGSGSSVFAVGYNEDCIPIRDAMVSAFEKRRIDAEGHISSVNNVGASLIE